MITVPFLYRPPTRAVSILPLLGHGVPRLPPGRKPPGPPPGPPPPQVLQMYGRKVGFALDLPPRRRDEDMLYSPELGKEFLLLLGPFHYHFLCWLLNHLVHHPQSLGNK